MRVKNYDTFNKHPVVHLIEINQQTNQKQQQKVLSYNKNPNNESRKNIK